MDASVIAALLSIAVFIGFLVTLHFWGRNAATLEEAMTQETIVRTLTGPVATTGMHARLPQPNPQDGKDDS